MAHSSYPSAVVVDDISFDLPDATQILSSISATFPTGLTALIGANGSGKTTLLRLIAADLTPTTGSVRSHGTIHRVEQRLPAHATVSDLLGITEIRAAITAIEQGSVEQHHFDAVGDNWDIEARAIAELSGLGFESDPSFLQREVASLSGGESTKITLAGAVLAQADITLLDEPTNNLDSSSRRWLYDALDDWAGTVIVVTHDVALLERVSALVDLTSHGAVSFTGTYADYREHQAALQAAAERTLRDADAELARAKTQAQVELQRQAQRERSGKKDRAQRKVLKVVADKKKNQSEKRAGSKSLLHQKAVTEASLVRAEADSAARTPDVIRIALPETDVPSSKLILSLHIGSIKLDVVGPERIRITGDNGTGKSTLLGALLGEPGGPWRDQVLAGVELTTPASVQVGVVAQRLDTLDEFPDALAAVRDAAPGRDPHEARALLARFLIRGDRISQAPATMSGGERFRVGVARVLFADPAPKLLILDEPTNNVDLDSVDQLVGALEQFQGAIMFVTHDEHLADGLSTTRRWQLSRVDGVLEVRDVLL